MRWKTIQTCTKNTVSVNRQKGLKLCHFETKTKPLKLSWIKENTNPIESSLKILFLSIYTKSIYFATNHKMQLKYQTVMMI